MKRKTYWILSIAIMLVVATVVVLIVVKPFSKEAEPIAIENRWHSIGAKWDGNTLVSDAYSPLLQIRYSSSIVKKGFINNEFDDWDYGEEWHNNNNNTISEINDSFDNIIKTLNSVSGRNVIFVKPDQKIIDLKVGDLIVLTTKDNSIDIPMDYETVTEDSDIYKMKIMVAIKDGKQTIDFYKIIGDGSKVSSSVEVNVKTKQ